MIIVDSAPLPKRGGFL